MTWALLNSSSPPNRVFTRPVDKNEVGFFYDGKFSGTADIIEHHMVNTPTQSLFKEANVSRTWIALKRLFPLLGASVKENPGTEDTSQPTFFVSEARLGTVGMGEINFGSVASSEAAVDFEERLNSSPRNLSEDTLACLHILSRTDNLECFHIIFNFAHIIIDGISAMALIRYFLDILSLPPTKSIPDLEARLALVIGCQNLNPNAHFSVPKQQWRRAIAKVILEIRRTKIQGGTTLPCKITAYTPFIPAKSRKIYVTFPTATSTKIMATCHRHKITLGHAHSVIAQIAGSRLLHRRYFRGEIGEEEWQWRKREPLNTHGPLNLRPHLDKRWYNNGGAVVVTLSINYFHLRLPFMPAVPYPRSQQNKFPMDNGSPPFSSLLSRGRFFLRCNMVKKQLKHIINHPLFFEIADANLPVNLPKRKMAWELWEKRQKGQLKEHEVSIASTISDNVIFHHGGSSFGNMDTMRPLEYPLPASHHFSSRLLDAGAGVFQPTPSNLEVMSTPVVTPKSSAHTCRIRVLSSSTQLRCRPTELYLGAATKEKQLIFWVSWDGNVYEDSVVQEWLDEVRAATEWYLVGGAQQQARL